MLPFLHSISLVSAATVGALVSAIWQGTVLAAMVFVCLRLMPGLSAAARSAIWLNVFMLLVLLHFLPAFAGYATGESSGGFSPVHLDLRWCIPIVAVWAALSLWRGTQLILSGIRLHGIARRATPVAIDTAPLEAGDHPTSRSAELCTSDEVARPCVFGFFKPRILMPPYLIETLSGEELQLVLQHEMEHLRRGDDWTNLLQKIALMLFPLNPVLYWVERRLCCERELACDDRVLKSSVGRKAYAICLTRLAEYSIVYRGLSLVLGAWERHSELASRVHRILSRPAKPMSGMAALTASAALVVGALGCAVMLSRSPQLVSFVPMHQLTRQPQSLSSASVPEMNLGEMGAAPQLVKAVMPRRPAHATSKLRPAYGSTLKQNPGPEIAASQPQPAPTQQTWVVLTEWRSAEAPPQIVIAVQRDTRPTYAAIQFANGWLIVQI